MILIIDNFDSFTWNLIDYIRRLGTEVEMVRNDIDPDSIDFSKYAGIVLSPGPGKPSESGYLMAFLKKTAGQYPILGICLGHQAIGEFFGASLTRAAAPMHGKTSAISCNTSNPIFYSLPETFSVVRYHSLILKELPFDLDCIASSGAGEIMAISHKNLPIYGIQFHPEAHLTEHGESIIANWIRICHTYQGLN